MYIYSHFLRCAYEIRDTRYEKVWSVDEVRSVCIDGWIEESNLVWMNDRIFLFKVDIKYVCLATYCTRMLFSSKSKNQKGREEQRREENRIRTDGRMEVYIE